MSSPVLKCLLRRHLLKTVLKYFSTGSFTVMLLYRKILYMTQVRDQRCLSGLSLCTTSLLKALVTFVMI